MAVTLRAARPDEYDDVGRVLVDSYLADDLLVAGTGYEEHLRAVAERARDAEVVVAVEDGEVVGTVTFCPPGSTWAEISEPGEGEFRMLAVAPAARRRGIGESLAAHCVDRSRALGYHAVVLSSRPQMRAAHRLYERLGFARTPELDWQPLPGVELLGYRLVLTGR